VSGDGEAAGRARRAVLASGNPDKARELAPLFPGLELAGAPAGFNPDETGTTLLQNAWIKASALRSRAPADALVIADDSGLLVHALGGRPGVFSSRYAGADATYADNYRRLLEELEGHADRRAAFVCVLVALAAGGEALVAVGSCPGEITPSPRGEGGFGYDPVFAPEGGPLTMAEMTPEQKAAVSHRGRAARRMAALLGLAA
jgi:XTP/dITP diphosphohydrolase